MTTPEPGGPGVFIGHGPLTPEQRASLLALTVQLKAKGYQVLLDIDEPGWSAGTDYRQVLHERLRDCEACILLFTTAGIKDSHWLPIEGGILENRRRTEPEFIAITIFAGAATPDDLAAEGRWTPLQLANLERLTFEDPNLLADLDRHLDVLLLRRLAYEKPLVAVLRNDFREITLADARPVLESLGHPVDGLPRRDLPLRLSLNFLQVRDVDRLGAAVLNLAPFKAEAAKKAFHMCLPFAWLDDGIARALKTAHSSQPGVRAAATRTASDITCGMLVARTARWPPWPTLVVADYEGDDPPQDLLGAARREMADYYSPGEAVSDDELRREIETDPCVLVVPGPLPDLDVVAPLRETFPAATLLFTATSKDDVRRMGYHPFVVYLETLPPQDDEDTVLHRRRRVLRYIDRIQKIGEAG